MLLPFQTSPSYSIWLRGEERRDHKPIRARELSVNDNQRCGADSFHRKEFARLTSRHGVRIFKGLKNTVSIAR
jgi:hypothetical protein